MSTAVSAFGAREADGLTAGGTPPGPTAPPPTAASGDSTAFADPRPDRARRSLPHDVEVVTGTLADPAAVHNAAVTDVDAVVMTPGAPRPTGPGTTPHYAAVDYGAVPAVPYPRCWAH